VAESFTMRRSTAAAEEWVAAPAEPVRVAVVVSPAGGQPVRDTWVVELEGHVLTPVQDDASHWRAVPHMPVKARVERLERPHG